MPLRISMGIGAPRGLVSVGANVQIICSVIVFLPVLLLSFCIWQFLFEVDCWWIGKVPVCCHYNPCVHLWKIGRIFHMSTLFGCFMCLACKSYYYPCAVVSCFICKSIGRHLDYYVGSWSCPCKELSIAWWYWGSFLVKLVHMLYFSDSLFWFRTWLFGVILDPSEGVVCQCVFMAFECLALW